TVSEHWRISRRPTSVEPVKVSFLTSGLEVISRPISRDLPVTILITPAGMPACPASAASANAESGVSLAGLMTIVQPAASAGAALRGIIAAGQFHRVTAGHT